MSARFLMLLLLDDGRIVPGASSETALDQQLMQLSQRRYRDARCAERHPGAGGGIEHPCRHHDDHAGRHLDVNDLTAGAPLDILATNAPPIERVPAVMNLDFLPDMGRMTGRLPSGAKHGCSPAPIAAASAPRRSTRLIDTAKLNGVDPQAWLADVLRPHRRSSGPPAARAAALELEATRNPSRCRLTTTHCGPRRMLTPIMCVPAIMDLDLLPDMGRMTGRLPSADVIGSSRAVIPAVSVPPRCTRSCRLRN